MRGKAFNGGAERQYSVGWAAVLIRNIGGVERAQDSVRGKESVLIGVEGQRFLTAATGARAAARFIGHVGECPDRLAPVQKVGAARKMRPVGAPSRLLFRLFNARLATARLIDQCGLTALTVLTAPSLDRRLAGNLVLDHGLANR